MYDYYNHYDESKKVTLKHVTTKWFKLIRLIIIVIILYSLYQLLGSDVEKCKVIDVNRVSAIAKCDSDIVQFSIKKFKDNISLSYGDSVNIHIGKHSKKVRKVKLNYTLMGE